VLITLASVTVGAAIAFNVQVGFGLAAALLFLLVVDAPAAAWAICALVFAIGFRALISVGLLPSVATFLDIPLAWGALLAALLKRGPRTAVASRLLKWLAGLALAVLASWVFHPTEVLRPIFYLALLGEPFALVGALLLDPPSPRLRKALIATAAALVAIQVPIALFQASRHGVGDQVQGTLYGAGAGGHVMAAIVVVGMIWLLTGARNVPLGWRVPMAAPLLLVPALADAKQVIFALIPGLLIAKWRRGIGPMLLTAGLAAVAVGSIWIVDPTGARSSTNFLQQANEGHSGKLAAYQLVWQGVRTDPQSFMFGKGPAETVSRAAFMTTDLLLKENSPLRAFGLQPAQFAIDAQTAAELRSGAINNPGLSSSFNSAQSSAMGVFGDLGVVGAVVYLGLFLSLFLALRRSRSRLAIAPLVGWGMLAFLGFLFDWLEEPPFTLFLAVLAALALTEANVLVPRLRTSSSERAGVTVLDVGAAAPGLSEAEQPLADS